ncbi:MAG: hypothetical protein QW228_07610 [Candidatus Aenigmatarchaeota archaeon]
MKSYEIRQLIENYYDIQKIRVETFNRLVCWVRENKEKIKEYLKSHHGLETHDFDASQCNGETQYVHASHYHPETHVRSASHRGFETHRFYASHWGDETHSPYALKLLEEAENQKGVKGMKKYSEFVKKFVLSQVGSETHGRGASHIGVETQESDASQAKCETQSSSASQVDIETQLKYAIFSEIENLIWFHNKLYETEKELQKRLDAWSKNHKLRKEFLNYVKGIGGVLASGIIAWLDEVILKAEHPSSLWKYCGLYPGSERKRGEKLPYNLKLKSFCWKIGQSFIKFKCFGRKLYDRFKEETKQKHPDWSKLHIHNYARRKVVKVFLACLWKKWREMNNLPTPEPYAIAHLKHSDLITPEMWMEKKGG